MNPYIHQASIKHLLHSIDYALTSKYKSKHIYIIIVLIELILNKMDTITLSAFSMKWDIWDNWGKVHVVNRQAAAVEIG